MKIQTCIDHTLLVLYDSFVSHTLKSMQCHVVHFVLNILIKMLFFFLTTTFQCLLPFIYLQANEAIFHYYSEIPDASISIIVYKYLS